jgi:hypothetical protein
MNEETLQHIRQSTSLRNETSQPSPLARSPPPPQATAVYTPFLQFSQHPSISHANNVSHQSVGNSAIVVGGVFVNVDSQPAPDTVTDYVKRRNGERQKDKHKRKKRRCTDCVKAHTTDEVARECIGSEARIQCPRFM